jgi:hypothetical protein
MIDACLQLARRSVQSLKLRVGGDHQCRNFTGIAAIQPPLLVSLSETTQCGACRRGLGFRANSTRKATVMENVGIYHLINDYRASKCD